jgi:endo-1,3(4)-beta-glucanase
MNKFLGWLLAPVLFTLMVPAHAVVWNPSDNWKDSYAVDGKCYCDSNGYDHGLDTKTAMTPLGVKNVVEICNAITRVLGKGSVNGRVPYNDIQCGNGPANDTDDEAGCPGRVDIGPAGCNQKGPKWDLASVYGTGNSKIVRKVDLSRDDWTVTASSGGAANALDGSLSTRWTTGAVQTSGQYFQIDAGKPVIFDTIQLNAGRDISDYPRVVNVIVSDDGRNWRTVMYRGEGSSAITSISFPKQTARFIRISQSGSNPTYWWSIAEVSLQISAPLALDPKGWTTVLASGDQSTKLFPLDGNPSTGWSTPRAQTTSDYYTVFRKDPVAFDSIQLVSNSLYAVLQGYEVSVTDGSGWRTVATGQGLDGTGIDSIDGPLTTINFPVQKATGIRIKPTTSPGGSLYWTISEMRVGLTDDAKKLDSKGWSLTGTNNTGDLKFAIDGDPKTRWSTNQKQQPGQYFQIDMLKKQRFSKIVLSTEGSPNDYARGFILYTSNDGLNWQTVWPGYSNNPVTTITLPKPSEARYIRIEQRGSDNFYWWSIHELALYDELYVD